MKRVTARWTICVAVGLVTSLFALGGARASDIVCHAHGGGNPVVCDDPNGTGTRCALDIDTPRVNTARNRLICDSPGMSDRYEHIYAEQQRMLHKGTIQNADIAAWRARRDACDSARCLDSLFHLFWRDKNSMHIALGPAPAPRAALDTSPPARHDPAPAPTPVASAPLASTAPPATSAASAPATPVAPSAPAQQAEARPASGAAPATRTGAPQSGFVPLAKSPLESNGQDASPVDAAPGATEVTGDPGESGSASLAMESMLSGFAVIGTGAGFLWHRRRTYAQYQARPAIPAAIVIAYALLLVNALLLPFTLGLK
ncbi:MAG: hypothetical protein JO067_02785 [Cupriavidus sp.]|nr:hypothetical protein [Cupriavidus sp.]